MLKSTTSGPDLQHNPEVIGGYRRAGQSQGLWLPQSTPHISNCLLISDLGELGFPCPYSEVKSISACNAGQKALVS